MPILSENKNSNNLEKEILSTLIFYKILNVPCLTDFEIYKHLIISGQGISMARLKKTLINSPGIKSQNGFYWANLPSIDTATNFFHQRIKNAKISAKKIKKAQKISRLLSIIPSIKSISISGSVSMNGARPESDIDFFIISSKKRIWLTRLLTVALTQLIGQRRHKNIIENKICLNIYVADENSSYPVKNMANSQMISMTLPIVNKNTFNLFLRANKGWISCYINNFSENIYLKNKTGNHSQKNNNLLNLIERILAKIFSGRIHRKTPDAKPPYLLISDTALLFHYPRSKNIEVTEKYNNLISQLTC